MNGNSIATIAINGHHMVIQLKSIVINGYLMAIMVSSDHPGNLGSVDTFPGKDWPQVMSICWKWNHWPLHSA